MYVRYASKICCAFAETTFVNCAVINKAPEDTTQLWKIHKQCQTAFWKLVCVQTHHSLEEAFHFFGRRSLPILGEAFQFVV